MNDQQPTGACARCGQVHTAGNTCHRSNGEPCGKPPMRGMTICSTHGGQAPQTKAARDRAEAEQQLEAEIVKAATTGPLPLLEPGTTLLEAVAMLAQGVAHLRQRIAGQDQPDLKELDGFLGQVERLARIAKLADDARLGERRLANEERLTQVYADQVKQLVHDLAVAWDALVRERLGLPVGQVVLDPMDPVVVGRATEVMTALESGAGG